MASQLVGFLSGIVICLYFMCFQRVSDDNDMFDMWFALTTSFVAGIAGGIVVGAFYGALT